MDSGDGSEDEGADAADRMTSVDNANVDGDVAAEVKKKMGRTRGLTTVVSDLLERAESLPLSSSRRHSVLLILGILLRRGV